MLRITKFVLLIAIITVLVVAGCSDRGHNTIDTYIGDGGRLVINHVFFDELLVQLNNKKQQLFMRAYVPNATKWGPPPLYNPPKPMPLLVLLAPQGADEFYYFNHGLEQIANELIESGEIEPMVIACLGNNPSFGGMFWSGNGGGSGNYDTLIAGTLISDYLSSNAALPFVIDSVSKRGIGGIGQGAYGAFRASLMHDSVYGSVSAIDGPLDFDGASGNSGFLDLFDDFIAEQSFNGNDTVKWIDEIDTSGSNPFTRMIIGASMAFSPHDTLFVPVFDPYDARLVNYDSSIFYSLADSTTLVSRIVGGTRDFDFHLPFDSTGSAYAPIWDMWKKNNLETLMADSGSARLANMKIWIASSTDPDPRGFNAQTQSWVNTLQGASINPEVVTYQGYPGHPAVGDRYLSDLLRKMLIFHDRSFRGLN